MRYWHYTHGSTVQEIELHSYLAKSSVEGPGMRFVIWVQGCSIRCSGCANEHMWETGRGQTMPLNTLFSLIQKTKEIEGVTLVGGEPFDQADPLALLAHKVQQFGLGVVTFTGYNYEDLCTQGTPSQHALLSYTDLLIDGPFVKEQQTLDLPWIGSTNQRYIHLSKRYMDYDLVATPNRIEVHYDASLRKIIINGLEDNSVISNLIKRLQDKGIITSR